MVGLAVLEGLFSGAALSGVGPVSPLTLLLGSQPGLHLQGQTHSPLQPNTPGRSLMSGLKLVLWGQQEKQSWESPLPVLSEVVTRAAKRQWPQAWTRPEWWWGSLDRLPNLALGAGAMEGRCLASLSATPLPLPAAWGKGWPGSEPWVHKEEASGQQPPYPQLTVQVLHCFGVRLPWQPQVAEVRISLAP